MKETGTIVRIEKEDCVIQVEPEGGCSHCSMKGCCQEIGKGTKELNLKCRNMELHIGDIVEIETTTRGFLTTVFLVFIFPLILSTTAYLIIDGQTENSGLAIGGFFGSFILSEFIIAWIDRLLGRKKVFEPRIVRRLETKPIE